MFYIKPHDEGFEITWEHTDGEVASSLSSELLLEGMSRSQEWDGGLIVARYRNAFETLTQIGEIFARIGASPEYDEELKRFLARSGAEQQLFRQIVDGHCGETAIPVELPEFSNR